jgi:hydroxyquinol 1,2-dioxygenase
VTTHLFAAGSQYIESDAVFGVKESLITAFAKHPAGTAPDGTKIDVPYYTVNYDFRLRRG